MNDRFIRRYSCVACLRLWMLEFVRVTEVILAYSYPPAVSAYEFSVLHEVFKVIQVCLQVPDVLQQAKMVFVLRMGHFELSHIYLPPLQMRQASFINR